MKKSLKFSLGIFICLLISSSSYANSNSNNSKNPSRLGEEKPGDINNDGWVDLGDYLLFQQCFQDQDNCDDYTFYRSDLNLDGYLDLLDFAEFQVLFGT